MNSNEALVDADTQRRAAIISGDVSALTRLLSDSLIWTHSSGKVENKAEFLANIASGAVVYSTLEVTDTSIRQHGNVFIYHGTLQGQASRDGVEKTLNSRFLSVWLQQQDAFTMLAWQSTGL